MLNDSTWSVIAAGIGTAFFVWAVVGPGGNSDVGWIGAPIYLGAGVFMAALAVYESKSRELRCYLGHQSEPMRSDLSRIMTLPVPCKHCGNEPSYPVAMVIDHHSLSCTRCEQPIDISSAEWSEFRSSLGEAVAQLQPIYDDIS